MCLGIPGRIVEIWEDLGLRMGTVDFGGVRREVCLAYLDHDTEVGHYAIVHAGFAISRLDEEEAQRTFELLKELGGLEELGETEGLEGAGEQGKTGDQAAAVEQTGPEAGRP